MIYIFDNHTPKQYDAMPSCSQRDLEYYWAKLQEALTYQLPSTGAYILFCLAVCVVAVHVCGGLDWFGSVWRWWSTALGSSYKQGHTCMHKPTKNAQAASSRASPSGFTRADDDDDVVIVMVVIN